MPLTSSIFTGLKGNLILSSYYTSQGFGAGCDIKTLGRVIIPITRPDFAIADFAMNASLLLSIDRSGMRPCQRHTKNNV